MHPKGFIQKTLKFGTLARSHIRSRFHDSAGFVRIIPTDRCNLHCQYCWQRNDASAEMSLEAFYRYLEKAVTLGVGMITFLGGEPMLWHGIYDAISACTKRRILTDMTTNGTLLNHNTILKLGESGLDYLNVSTDGLRISSVSKKNNLIRRELIGALREAKKRYGMHVRLNAVIYKDNFDEIKALIEFAKEENIQISIGYVVPPIHGFQLTESDIYFSQADHIRLQEIVDSLVEKKRNGYPIIDPDAYFENIFRYLRRERFWSCNYPTRYGWINVAPTGRIRSCTKKMDELSIDFLEMDRLAIRKLRAQMQQDLNRCNVDCYSNCAYDSAYYVQNKFQFVRKIVGRLKHSV